MCKYAALIPILRTASRLSALATLMIVGAFAFSQNAGDTRYSGGVVQFYNGTNWISTDQGDTGIACSMPGAIRYNVAQTRVEFCNGSFWRHMVSGLTTAGSGTAGSLKYGSGTLMYYDSTKWVHAHDGSIHRWKLDETSGTTAVDGVGSLNGTMIGGLNGSSDSVSGLNGTAIQFNGSTDGIDIPHNSSLNFGTGDFTINAWFKGNYSLVDSYPRIFEKLKTSGGVHGVFFQTSGSTTEDYPSCAIVNSGSYQVANAVGYSVRNNVWRMITCVRTGSLLKIYIDGVERASMSVSSVNLNTTVDASIGYSKGWASDFLQGALDDVRVYNHALTAPQIAGLYAALNP